MDLREEAYRRFDDASWGVLGAADKGGVFEGMPDWIDGFGEKGTNGEEGCCRFDMAAAAAAEVRWTGELACGTGELVLQRKARPGGLE